MVTFQERFGKLLDLLSKEHSDYLNRTRRLNIPDSELEKYLEVELVLTRIREQLRNWFIKRLKEDAK
jgi:hypothetical protein